MERYENSCSLMDTKVDDSDYFFDKLTSIVGRRTKKERKVDIQVERKKTKRKEHTK